MVAAPRFPPLAIAYSAFEPYQPFCFWSALVIGVSLCVRRGRVFFEFDYFLLRAMGRGGERAALRVVQTQRNTVLLLRSCVCS